MKPSLVIMAAGLGSRYGGNKQVEGVGAHNEILMEYSIYDAIRAGFTKVVFITFSYALGWSLRSTWVLSIGSKADSSSPNVGNTTS